jgi:hypothetical protein
MKSPGDLIEYNRNTPVISLTGKTGVCYHPFRTTACASSILNVGDCLYKEQLFFQMVSFQFKILN